MSPRLSCPPQGRSRSPSAVGRSFLPGVQEALGMPGPEQQRGRRQQRGLRRKDEHLHPRPCQLPTAAVCSRAPAKLGRGSSCGSSVCQSHLGLSCIPPQGRQRGQRRQGPAPHFRGNGAQEGVQGTGEEPALAGFRKPKASSSPAGPSAPGSDPEPSPHLVRCSMTTGMAQATRSRSAPTPALTARRRDRSRRCPPQPVTFAQAPPPSPPIGQRRARPRPGAESGTPTAPPQEGDHVVTWHPPAGRRHLAEGAAPSRSRNAAPAPGMGPGSRCFGHGTGTRGPAAGSGARPWGAASGDFRHAQDGARARPPSRL
ncbi:basic salivary proline-rich protein 2-like [Neopsephotus bourkii]|uniref:basic salivary proline-rich protein 2-like n=1 Tax=Neopsephotus bourkii TaxID=309878 RepID=UPI002AA50F7A|nr:basic salivary proline-rich protein 2-like [Neopsephotus bourkii]